MSESDTPKCDSFGLEPMPYVPGKSPSRICAEGWENFARELERELTEATAWKTEIQGAIQRSGMGILRTSQGPSGTMIGYRPEIENFHFQKETELIAENAGLRAELNRLRKALESARITLVRAIEANVEIPGFDVSEHVTIKEIDQALADQ